MHFLTTAFLAQANLTDNTPVFILGGNIVPMGPNGTVTTTAARAGDLTLVAAMPAASSTHFDRCSQGCAGTSQPGNLVACGHMYLDQGEAFLFLCNLLFREC